ncbi:hypothetical protein [Nitrobacter hamburgensis]|uniref:hypothetical protein n=1 Tax=Nitrobacter hamburgensis TaxID=912 RepID=UPI00059DA44C|nr:hypothetical protein [Nitrobacter hamburgensis]
MNPEPWSLHTRRADSFVRSKRSSFGNVDTDGEVGIDHAPRFAKLNARGVCTERGFRNNDSPVMAGLDPAIHRIWQKFFEANGSPDQVQR